MGEEEVGGGEAGRLQQPDDAPQKQSQWEGIPTGGRDEQRQNRGQQYTVER